MPESLFRGWKVWQKSVFILACTILVAVCLGSAKLLYTHRRLHKYAGVAMHKEQRQKMLRRRNLKPQAFAGVGTVSDELPLDVGDTRRGVKAEELWSPRGDNAKMPSSRSTSAPSSFRHSTPRKDFVVDMEKQDSQDESRSNAGAGLTYDARYHDINASSDEGIAKLQRCVRSSLEEPKSRPARPRCPPMSYDRYRGGPYVLRRQSNTTNTLHALESIYQASTSLHGEDRSSTDSSNQSSSTDDSGPISFSAPSLLSHDSAPKHRAHSSKDLDMLHKHRTSQVAEQGQLKPRERSADRGSRIDLTTSAPNPRDSAYLDRLTISSAWPKTRPSARNNDSAHSSSSFQNIDALPLAVRRASLPDVTPFTEFCRRTSQNPRPESLRSLGKDDAIRHSQDSRKGIVQQSMSWPEDMPASEGALILRLPPPAILNNSFEHTVRHSEDSQLLRAPNPNFEILRPGTLKPSLPQPAVVHKQEAEASGDLVQNGTWASRSSMETLKKLRRKRYSNDSTSTSQKKRFSLFS